MYINNISDNNKSDCDNDYNNNDITKNKALHRHFPMDCGYNSEDSRTTEHHHILEKHFLIYIIPFT